MLLSMYLSYYASRAWMKTHYLNYILGMTVLVIVTSFFSTIPVYVFGWFPILFPLGWFSFPFSSIVHVDMHREMGNYTYTYAHDIQFLSLRILSVSNESIRLLFVFSFYLLVNFLGVILGYWIDKRLVGTSLKGELFDFFAVSGFLCFSMCFLISIVTFQLLFIQFFWVPALIATAIYGLKRRKE